MRAQSDSHVCAWTFLTLALAGLCALSPFDSAFVSPAQSRCGRSRVAVVGVPSGGCADACFESVTVSSPEAVANAVQVSRFGTYTKLPNVMQGDRPVYQLAGSTVMYLFYWPSTRNWLIGSSYSSGTAGVKSTDNAAAACPDQATGWQAWVGAWVGTYTITVVQTQSRPPTTAVGKRSRCVCMRSA